MANASNSSFTGIARPTAPITTRVYYAVYDSCVTNNIPSRDFAFIEERPSVSREEMTNDEKRFPSLRDAKIYVEGNFES